MKAPLREQQRTLSISWPSPQDYNEALQNPAHCFCDPALASGETELDKLGLPRPRSGMFASVYKVHSHGEDWAVRCFLQAKADQVHRYVQIRDWLQKASLPCLVPFDLQEQGIRVCGKTVPMLKMEWCHGESLNYWLAKNLRKKSVLESFLGNWRSTVMALASAGIAHGDLQHGNILVQEGQIKLVDYDGVYVPDFKGMPSSELGHRNYQHPQRNASHFGPYLDNFSAWLIYASVLISGCDPHIWHDFEGGEECLLFRRQDLENPGKSEVFHVLEHHHNPQIRGSSRTLRYLLSLAPENVPGLETPLQLPDDLPDLDHVISDLPEWLTTDVETQEAACAGQSPSCPTPAAPELLKRWRRKNVPANISGENTVRGRWLYNEHGLAFTPESAPPEENAEPAKASPPLLHSPLLDTTVAPAVPYRKIAGKLHSPVLDDDAFIRELSDDPLMNTATIPPGSSLTSRILKALLPDRLTCERLFKFIFFAVCTLLLLFGILVGVLAILVRHAMYR